MNVLRMCFCSHRVTPPRSLFSVQVIADQLDGNDLQGLKDMFEMIDADGSGTITYEELRAGLMRIGSPLTEAEIRALMDSVWNEMRWNSIVWWIYCGWNRAVWNKPSYWWQWLHHLQTSQGRADANWISTHRGSMEWVWYGNR